MESFRHIRADGNKYVDSRTFGHRLLYFAENIRLANAYDCLHRSCIIAIHNVVTSKHMCCRNGNCSQFVESKHSYPPFQTTLLNKHHHITTIDTKAAEIGSGLVAHLFKVGEGQSSLGTFVVGPKQSNLVRRNFSPSIHYIISEIEVVGDDELQVLPIVFL